MRITWALVPAFAAAFAAGCASGGGSKSESSKSMAGHEKEAEEEEEDEKCEGCEDCPFLKVKEAVAVVHATQGNQVHGVVRFVETAEGVRITAEIGGLKPNAKHAFHIHEFGDCSSADASSAGGHYNPEGHPHAGPDAAARHAGDLGNLESDGHGGAMYDRVIPGLTIGGMHDPILGRSVVIHADPDDFTTQPSGKAGARIACGVIGVAKPAGAK